MPSRQTPVSKRTAVRQAIRRFMVGEHAIEGAALVEFTIIAPLLVVMSIYTMDFGLYFFNNLEIQNAAQAGAQWAIANGAYNNNAIANAGANATRLPANQITVTSTEFCGCPSANGAVTLQNGSSLPANPCATPLAICSSGATCSGGALAGNYVAVCANPTTAYKSFVGYGLTKVAPPINATAMVRIQ